MVRAGSPVLDAAHTLLNMPDLFNFWLSGRMVSEFTIATTSQCYDPRLGEWAFGLLKQLDIPHRIFGPIVAPGTVLGPLHPSVAAEVGGRSLQVIASAGHDTASAVAAVPAEDTDHSFLSSGTWSLMGVLLDEPLIHDRSLDLNFTNEGGADGSFRFLKNIMGLWLVQECRRTWASAGESYTYDELTHLAEKAPAFGPLIDPGDHRFLAPGDMPLRIQAFCRDTGQQVPESKGQLLRTILESLALEYRWTAEKLDELVGRRLPVIHIIGGGSQNRLLNQITADATGRAIVAGPVEATAIGNILVQAAALGHISSLSEGRQLVRRSFDVQTYEPHDHPGWDEAYARYHRLRAD
jgi:rhamnulokinase